MAPSPTPPELYGDAYFQELVRCVFGILLPELGDLAATEAMSVHFIEEALKTAKEEIGPAIVYDQALMDSLECDEFELVDYAENDAKLKQGLTLNEILEESLVPLRCKAGSEEELRQRFAGLDGAETAIEVLCHGARDMMIDDFTPNGGKEMSPSPSYLKMRPICNDALKSLVREGKAIAFSMDTLIETGAMKELHDSSLMWAEKAKKEKGRVCLNTSKRSKNFESVNKSINRERAEMIYPMRPLPLLPDLAEMACQQRDAHPGVLLSGATIDIKSGYNQFPQSVESAKRVATKIKIPTQEGTGPLMKMLVVIYLCGIWGHAIAGNIFCAANYMVDQLHNLGQRISRSLTYIDDTMMISPTPMIDQSLKECIEAAEAVWGKGVVQEEKVNKWIGELEGIGWHLCFRSWRVQPKLKGLAKLLVRLFETVPIGKEWVKVKDMEKLIGLIQWYAVGIPAGTSFIASLYACPKVKTSAGKEIVRLTYAAQRDLMWWRALIVVVFRHKFLLGASIDAVRRHKVPQWYMTTDAAKSVGGGATLATSRGGTPEPMSGDAIRWTGEELLAFQRMGVSINTLEYYAAIYYVMLWAETLRGTVVFLECDNTAAVAWLMKGRTARDNAAADAIAKIFTLFCLTYKICIISRHLPGVNNEPADFLSRDLQYMPQDGDEDICRGRMSDGDTREQICRKLLKECVISPESVDSSRVHEILTALRGVPGSTTAK